MKNIIWLSTFRRGDDIDIIEHEDAYGHALPASAHEVHPRFAILVGKSCKSVALRGIFRAAGEVVPCEPHGQIRLWSEPSSRTSTSPLFFIDCEMHEVRSTQSERMHIAGPEAARRLRFASDGSNSSEQRDVGLRLYAQVIRPVANVICLFSEDLDGMTGTQEVLAYIVASCSRLDTPRMALCRLMVVLSGSTRKPDLDNIVTAFVQGTTRNLVERGVCSTDQDALDMMCTAFSDISVVDLDDSASPDVQAATLAEAVNCETTIAEESRSSCRRAFSLAHSIAFMRKALERFCLGNIDAFDLIQACRGQHRVLTDLETHVLEVMELLGSQQAITQVGVPLLASAFVLNSCPPGTHCMWRPLQIACERY